MNPEMLNVGKEVLSGPLFTVSGTPIDFTTLLTAVFVLIVTFYLANVLSRALERSETVRRLQGPTARVMTERLIKGLIWFVGIAIAIGTLGIDIGALLTASAVFAVGAGLALQNVAQNVVAGFLLIMEQTIKPGDILEVNGEVVQIDTIALRATTGHTLDDEAVIIPNAKLAGGMVKNYTLQNRTFRLRVDVGVSYRSNMKDVMQVLDKVARDFTGRSMDRSPVVLLMDFGDSAVVFNVSVWTNRPWYYQSTLSALREDIFEALEENNIQIAYPQLDIHLPHGLRKNPSSTKKSKPPTAVKRTR